MWPQSVIVHMLWAVNVVGCLLLIYVDLTWFLGHWDVMGCMICDRHFVLERCRWPISIGNPGGGVDG